MPSIVIVTERNLSLRSAPCLTLLRVIRALKKVPNRWSVIHPLLRVALFPDGVGLVL